MWCLYSMAQYLKGITGNEFTGKEPPIVNTTNVSLKQRQEGHSKEVQHHQGCIYIWSLPSFLHDTNDNLPSIII